MGTKTLVIADNDQPKAQALAGRRAVRGEAFGLCAGRHDLVDLILWTCWALCVPCQLISLLGRGLDMHGYLSASNAVE